MKGENVGRDQYDFIQNGKGERSNLSPFIFLRAQGHRPYTNRSPLNGLSPVVLRSCLLCLLCFCGKFAFALLGQAQGLSLRVMVARL